MNACCGHGQVRDAYIQDWDGECIRGEEAIDAISKLATPGTDGGNQDQRPESQPQPAGMKADSAQ